MEDSQISIDVMRVQTMDYAINQDFLSSEQLYRLANYIFSDAFAEEFLELEASSYSIEEKQEGFEKIYKRSTTPLELMN